MNAETHMKYHTSHEMPTEPIPSQAYTSRAYYDREVDGIFRKDWLWIAREEDIPNPGDYKVKRLEFAQASIIVIRGKDGVIRGFHNVCRHRGNKVIPETGEETFGRSRAAVISCRFHGWVYNAEGKLVDVPRADQFPSCFEKADSGLVPVATEVWQGFVFINLDPEPAKGLRESLGGVGDHLDGYPFHEMTHSHTYYTHLSCNWKVAMDAFMEGYHVPTIHSGSFPGLVSGWIDDVTLYGDHRSLGFYVEGANPPTPIGSLANSMFSGSIAMAQQGNDNLPPSVNPDRSEYFVFDQSIIFPNTMILAGTSLWFTVQMWPVAQDRCLFEGRYFMRAPASNSEEWAQHYSLILQRNAWLEDTATMEDTQSALKSRVLHQIPLMDEEILVRHAYEVIKRRVGPVEAVA